MKRRIILHIIAPLSLLGGTLLLYPVFFAFFGVVGGAVLSLLAGCLLRWLLAEFRLSPRQYLATGILLAAGCIVGSDVAFGLLFRAVGFRDNVFLAEIAFLWMAGYLCFAAMPFLFSASVRRFRLPLALAVAALGGLLLVMEPFYWGAFDEDGRWSTPKSLLSNRPVPIWNNGKPPVRLAAAAKNDAVAVIGWNGVETLLPWGSNGYLPELLFSDGDSGFFAVETGYGGDSVSIRIAPWREQKNSHPAAFMIPALTLYPNFSPAMMKIAYFNCYANSGTAGRGEIRLTWRLRLLDRKSERVGDATTVVGDLLLNPAAGTVSVEPGRIFPFAPIRVGVAGETAWSAWRSPRNLDVLVSCRPGTVWSKPERLTGGVAWEFPFRGVTAAGNRKSHFIWEDERNSFLHFPLVGRPCNADLFYRNFDSEAMRWSGERKLSTGCKYVFCAAVAAEKDTVAAVWIGAKNGSIRRDIPRRLFYSVSFDGGKNWGKPRAIPGTVSADALELYLQDNTLHLVYGRRIWSETRPRHNIVYRRRALAENGQ